MKNDLRLTGIHRVHTEDMTLKTNTRTTKAKAGILRLIQALAHLKTRMGSCSKFHTRKIYNEVL